MDSLKLIPQVFFDLIGRVVPGAIGIVAYLLLTNSTWSSFLSRIMGPSFAGDKSQLVTAIVFLCASYVVGQLLSPGAKLVQRIGEWKVLKPKPKEDGAYDWLRLHHPEAGASCAKIRAEFTMHNGLALVLLISTAAYPLSRPVWRWSVFCGLAIATVLAGIRGRTTRDTFHDTVRKFAKAAGYSAATQQVVGPERG
jgi:hypothetical protein